MNNWKIHKLSEIIPKAITGEWGDDVGEIKVLRTTNFQNDGTINFVNVVTRSISQKKIDQKALKFGDTIIEKSGGSPSQPVGRVVYFDKVDDIFLCNNFTSVLRPSSSVNSKYVFWFLFNNHLTGKTLNYQNKTTGIINLKLERYLQELKIPLPPFPVQNRIAEILDKVDALRKKDRQLLQHYDDLAHSMFINMFGDPINNEKEWEMRLVKSLAKKEKHSIKAGPFGSSLKKEYYVPNGYKIYGQEQVIKDDLTFGNYYIDESRYQHLKSCKVNAGDILISLVGTYGKISIVPDDFEPGIINPRLMKISLDPEICNSVFFKFLLQTKEVKNRISSFSRGGTMDIVNVGIISDIMVINPPILLQNQFGKQIENIERQKQKVRAQLGESENLFQKLLQDGFNGTLN